MRGGDSDEDDEFNNNNFADRKGIQVVLKILDQSHKDIALVSIVMFALMVTYSYNGTLLFHYFSLVSFLGIF